MDTLAERWAQLEPHVEAFGPEDGLRRPAVLLFHGCGGMRPHLAHYARALAAVGHRAFVVDSYAPRGWSRTFSLSFVCTGIVLRGSERAGDVLAAIHGVSARADVDADRLVLAGWSHGSWSIMDLMTMSLERPGEAGLADGNRQTLAGLKGLALFYPYLGPGALSRSRPWARRIPAWAVIARHDHLTTVANAERVYGHLSTSGSTVDRWLAEGTHAFDEETGAGPMRYDSVLRDEATGRLLTFVSDSVGV